MEIIPIDEKIKTLIEAKQKNIDAYNSTIRDISNHIQTEHDSLWSIIKDSHLEVGLYDRAIYKPKEGLIYLYGKKTKDLEETRALLDAFSKKSNDTSAGPSTNQGIGI